ncbi:MAG: DUF4133 domain-containing protein [Bacteroidota bacterium]
MNNVYAINKGVSKPIVFKGLKAQWIGWLAGGLLSLLLLFAVCYIAGAPVIACVVVVMLLGAGVFTGVSRGNKKYGEHGWMKQMAYRATPKQIKCDKLFQ